MLSNANFVINNIHNIFEVKLELELEAKLET